MRDVIAAVSLAVVALTGCATRPPIPPETATPFHLTQALGGVTEGRGEFSSVTGARRGFSVRLEGRLENGVFVLVEDFVFDDGEIDRKTWRLRETAPGEWRGTREDVVGEARGFSDGPAFRLEYLMDLPRTRGRTIRVRFRDVLAVRADGAVVNRARVTFWGAPVGRVELTVRRPASAPAEQRDGKPA